MRTQCERLLQALLEGQRITPLDSWQNMGIYRLASRIHDLRDGYLNRYRFPIQKEMIEVKNQYGDTARVACYWMDDQDIIDWVIRCKENNHDVVGRDSTDWGQAPRD